MRHPLALTLLLPFALLSGCSTPQVVRETSSSVQLQGLYTYGAGGRDLLLRVRGNPFATSPSDLEQVIGEEFSKGGLQQPATHVTAHPDKSARRGYMIVMDFADPPAIDPCAATNSEPVPDKLSGNVEVSFCVSGRPMVQVRGSATDAKSPSDPDFRAMIRLIAAEMFKADEYQGGDGNITN